MPDYVTMKVFISWSGPTSQTIAQELREWLPLILPAVKPFITTTDIDKGARWAGEISRELELSHYGLTCLTTDNIASTWLAFEAGALSKPLGSRIATLLFGLKHAEVPPPLNMSQGTLFNEIETRKLVNDMNAAAPKEEQRNERELDKLFPLLWPQINEPVIKCLESDKTCTIAPKVDTAEILAEIMAMLRQQSEILSSPEKFLAPALERLSRSVEPSRAAYLFNKYLFQDSKEGRVSIIDDDLLAKSFSTEVIDLLMERRRKHSSTETSPDEDTKK
jgi:hypothetical protein